jgi:hypothetical protein
MPDIWDGWRFQTSHADKAMISSLRRGNVPFRGEAHEPLFPDLPIVRPRTDRPLALPEVAAGLLVLQFSLHQLTLAEYEATEVGSVLVLGGITPAPVRVRRTAVLSREELAWEQFRDDLIRFELPRGATPSGSRRKGKGRIPNPVWKDAKTEAMKWLKDNGCPASGDGRQTDLEGHIADFLDSRGYDLADSTIRSHVAGWIVEYRGFLST